MSVLQLNVLVAYATRNGSTREVADRAGTVALEEGAVIEVVPAHTVAGPLKGYDLVVLGAPIYSGRWHREARRFLKRHRDELSAVPVAVFALGPRSDDDEAWRRSWQQLRRALARRPWLKPASVAVFGGADPARHRRAGRRDLRDWPAIEAWTRETLHAVAATVAGSAPATGHPDQ